ncbi:PapB/FocB family fimbrial expression transcriptional regulator [Citrobacter sp.]|uniref:PapB/FocB family fimbrial expression transcriptional regulator n=1 Tax=Citrobacter sp. TaxID=1896336 RepID=UPI002FC80FA3
MCIIYSGGAPTGLTDVPGETDIRGICAGVPGSLFPGRVSVQYFSLLADISPIRSRKVIQALHGYFVEGLPRGQVCEAHGVGQGYLSVKIKELKILNRKIHDLCRFCLLPGSVTT